MRTWSNERCASIVRFVRKAAQARDGGLTGLTRQEAIDAVTASNTQPGPDRDLALRLLATVYDHPQESANELAEDLRSACVHNTTRIFSEALRGALC
jgi:hypothetical protein